MSYEVHGKELAAVMSLPAEQRYEYFLRRVADWEKLWSLGDEDGWALATGPNDQVLVPVWPASAFASACASGEWRHFRPKSILVEDWLSKWIPGIVSDDRSVAIFPTIDNVGMIVNPYKVADDIREAISQYG